MIVDNNERDSKRNTKLSQDLGKLHLQWSVLSGFINFLLD